MKPATYTLYTVGGWYAANGSQRDAYGHGQTAFHEDADKITLEQARRLIAAMPGLKEADITFCA